MTPRPPRSSRWPEPSLRQIQDGSTCSPGCKTLALAGHEARRWQPKRLRLRLLSIPARHVRTGRRLLLHLAATAPFTALVLQALDALAQLTAPPLADTG